MRIVFAGTPKFAVESLAILHKSDHEIIAVYCQPDRPKGRGKVLTACPVRLYAEENNIPKRYHEKLDKSTNMNGRRWSG